MYSDEDYNQFFDDLSNRLLSLSTYFNFSPEEEKLSIASETMEIMEGFYVTLHTWLQQHKEDAFNNLLFTQLFDNMNSYVFNYKLPFSDSDVEHISEAINNPKHQLYHTCNKWIKCIMEYKDIFDKKNRTQVSTETNDERIHDNNNRNTMGTEQLLQYELPSGHDTDNIRRYFDEAVKKGWAIMNKDRKLEWIGIQKGVKTKVSGASLAYFIHEIYCPRRIPWNVYNEYFTKKNLNADYVGLETRGRQTWQDVIDELIKSLTKNI